MEKRKNYKCYKVTLLGESGLDEKGIVEYYIYVFAHNFRYLNVAST
jgi:hypothetical protein